MTANGLLPRRSGLTRVDIVVVTNVTLVGLLFLVTLLPTFSRPSRGRSSQTKCGNNLKQIGMAAIQYADDKRFFPHLSKIDELDGGWKSNTATRVARALVHYGYDDNPESFICPSSPDQFTPLTDAAKRDIRAFRWSGAPGDPLAPSPMHRADASDVPLHESLELSYGWTRRGLTTNSVSTVPVAGDKSRIVEHDDEVPPASKAAHKDNMIGNHKDCMIVVCSDAHTVRITPNGDQLTTRNLGSVESASRSGGFLGVLDDEGHGE
jgi:hypothetical protein